MSDPVPATQSPDWRLVDKLHRVTCSRWGDVAPVAIAVNRDPMVNLCGKVFQLLGLDTGHEFLLFRC
jgi:hypothetical protein